MLSAGPAFALEGRTANFSAGHNIVVVDTVKVRSGPSATQIGTQQAGAAGVLVGSPVNANGYTWWQVNYATGVDGWTAEDFMQSPTVAMQKPQAVAGKVAGVSTVSADIARQEAINALLAQLAALTAQLQKLSH